MVPDPDLQLQVVLKALTDTVMPALDSGQRVAIEQLGLSIATLGLVRSRLGLASQREWHELANAIDLGRSVATLAVCTELADALADAEAARDAPNPSADARAHATRAVLSCISRLVRDADDASAPAMMRMVVEHSRASCDLARAWCLPAGFEPDPQEVPALETLLAARRGEGEME